MKYRFRCGKKQYYQQVDEDTAAELAAWEEIGAKFILQVVPDSSIKYANLSLELHRLVVNAECRMGDVIHHVDGDVLHNCNKNIRIASFSEKSISRKKSAANTSGFKGVSWCKRRSGWKAQIYRNKKAVALGVFDSPEDAAKAYDAAARELFGDFAALNFPAETERSAQTATISSALECDCSVYLTSCGSSQLPLRLDIETLSSLRYFSDIGGFFVARSRIGGLGVPRFTIAVHRLVMKLDRDVTPCIDHKNGDGLDNRRENLRPASRAQNNRNSSPHRDSAAAYFNVTWRPKQQVYIARYTDNDGNRQYVGRFATAEKAAYARDEAERSLQNPFSRFNFPRVGERGLDGKVCG